MLKSNGYNLEHNFGHGKETLASVLVSLNLLAFAFHTAAYLGLLAWRAAVAAGGAKSRFFRAPADRHDIRDLRDLVAFAGIHRGR